MSSHDQGPSPEWPDSNASANTNDDARVIANANKNANSGNRQSASEHWEPWGGGELTNEATQPYPVVPRPAAPVPSAAPQPPPAQRSGADESNEGSSYAQFSHREHVTSPLPAHSFQPVYPPMASAPASPNAQGQPPLVRGPEQQRQLLQPPGWQQNPSQSAAPAMPGVPSYPNYPAQPAYPGNVGYPAVYPGSQAGRPPYPPYPGYQGYPPYPAQPGYGQYPYPPPYGWQPAPKRDGYQLAMSIVVLVGSALAILAGAACAFVAVLIAYVNTSGTQLPAEQLFSATLTLLAFACAGLIGGGFSLYHSIRALLRKPSAAFAMPPFWIFVLLYAGVIAVGFVLKADKMAVTHAPLTIFLIALAALFPALALLALAARRLRNEGNWPTTWRRFTAALTSGATLGIGLALLLELGLLLLLVRGQTAANLTQCIDTPDLPVCQQNPAVFNLILIVAALVAPLVEETVKPLAVALFIGRVRSASEAFMLGMAAGIGFDLIETVGYIGSGYHDWVSVALQRTGTGLLHGFGAAMVALGWYYLTHAKDKRILRAFSCWLYAVLQHAIWNGSVTLVLLPAPVGPLVNSWNLNLGFTTLPFPETINIIEAILFFAFFLYMTGRLRRTTLPASTSGPKPPSPVREPQLAGRL